MRRIDLHFAPVFVKGLATPDRGGAMTVAVEKRTPDRLRIVQAVLLFWALVIAPTEAVVRGKTDAKPLVAEPTQPAERSKPAALLEVPLRDPSICRGPEGAFYLTGTLSDKDAGEDFDNNPGIRLWKSKDLKTWEDLGLVWKPTTREPDSEWVARPVSIMDRLDSPRHNSAITATEIHYLKGTFWLAFSRNHYGTGLLKSSTGKPEGPYVAPAKTSMITHWGSDPSLFEDDDGSVYWLWAGPQVFIAKMNADLSGLAEAPRALTCAETPDLRGTKTPSPVSDYLGRSGPFLYKVNGVYHLSAADIGMKHATTVSTVFVAGSKESVYGPYAAKTVLMPHAGQTTVFQDDTGRWLATYGGLDRFSVFRDRVGIVPLEWIEGYRESYYGPNLGVSKIEGGPLLVMNRCKVFTERGPWTKLQPLLPATLQVTNGEKALNLWDTNIIQAPDGYFYTTGSQNGRDYIRKLRVWRSKDLRRWEDYIVSTFADEPHLPASRKNLDLPLNNLGNCYMDSKISWLPKQKTFAVSSTIYNISDKVAPHIAGADRGNFSGVYVSESGTIQGPWRWHDAAMHSAVYFELDDGRTAVLGGVNGGFILKPGYWDRRDGKQQGPKGISEEFRDTRFGTLNPPDTFGGYVEDSGTQFLRMGKQWVMMPCSINGRQFGYPSEFQAYSTAFLTANELTGPWSKWQPAVPYGGHASIFQGLDKQWYGLVWMFRPIRVAYNHSPALVRLQVQFTADGRLERMDIDPDWTVDDYVPPTWVK